jgi:TonB family protein
MLRNEIVLLVAGVLAALPTSLGAMPQADSDSVFAPDELTERPKLVSKPRAIPGNSPKVFKRIVVRFVLDTSGRAEPASVKIVETVDSGLDNAAEQYVLEMMFQPARVNRRPVRALVDVPVWLPTQRVDTMVESAGVVIDTSVHRVGEAGKPEIIWGPPLRYPEDLRQRGIEGRVVVQAIVDTTGRAEPQTVRVLTSADHGFDGAAKAWLLAAHFRAAYLKGRPVRVLVQLPIDFRIRW